MTGIENMAAHLQDKFESAKGADNMSKQETRKVQTKPTRLPLFGAILPRTKLQDSHRVKRTFNSEQLTIRP